MVLFSVHVLYMRNVIVLSMQCAVEAKSSGTGGMCTFCCFHSLGNSDKSLSLYSSLCSQLPRELEMYICFES